MLNTEGNLTCHFGRFIRTLDKGNGLQAINVVPHFYEQIYGSDPNNPIASVGPIESNNMDYAVIWHGAS